MSRAQLSPNHNLKKLNAVVAQFASSESGSLAPLNDVYTTHVLFTFITSFLYIYVIYLQA